MSSELAAARERRERARKRRNKKQTIKLKYLVDVAFIAAFITMIVGWAIPLVVLWLIAGCVFFASSGIMSAVSVYDFFKSPKKSPEYKSAIWGMSFYTAFAILGAAIVILAIINLP